MNLGGPRNGTRREHGCESCAIPSGHLPIEDITARSNEKARVFLMNFLNPSVFFCKLTAV